MVHSLDVHAAGGSNGPELLLGVQVWFGLVEVLP